MCWCIHYTNTKVCIFYNLLAKSLKKLFLLNKLPNSIHAKIIKTFQSFEKKIFYLLVNVHWCSHTTEWCWIKCFFHHSFKMLILEWCLNHWFTATLLGFFAECENPFCNFEQKQIICECSHKNVESYLLTKEKNLWD